MKFHEWLKIKEASLEGGRHYYGATPQRSNRMQAPTYDELPQDFVNDDDAPDETNARNFFGLGPNEPIDLIDLRDRVSKKKKKGADPVEVKRWYDYLVSTM